MPSAMISKLPQRYYPWRWAMTFDYDREMIEALKERIDYRQRRWNADAKQWWFTEDAVRHILFLAEQFCGTVDFVDDVAERDLSEEDIQAYMLLHLLPSAPKAVIRAAYKAMAMLAHPDRGGDVLQMQVINAAYAQLMVGGEERE
jgi:hypothetical protein